MRMMPVWLSLLLVAPLLAGCLGDQTQDDRDDDTDTDETPGPWTLDSSVTDCPEVIGVLLLGLDELQAHLPENFTARDAADFFELPQETGRGVLFFNSIQCGHKGAAEIGIYTHAPQVENYSAAGFDFYTLSYAADDPETIANLTAVGANAHNATIAAGTDATGPVVAQGTAQVDGHTHSYSFETAGTAPQPFEFTARFWHVVPDGLVVWEYILPGKEAHAGGLTSCTFPAGSTVATIAGQQDCTGLETASLLFLEQTFEGTIAYLPGAEAR